MQRLRIIDSIHFFDGLSSAEKEKVSRLHLRIFRYEPHTTIIHSGDKDNHLYFLIKGTATVVGDKNLPMAILQPGEVFGEISFLTPRPRSASVVANNEVVVMRVDRPYFEQLDSALREKLKDKLIAVVIERLFTNKANVIDDRASFDWTYDD